MTNGLVQSLEGRLPKHILRAPTSPFHTHKSCLLASGAQHEVGAATLPSSPYADPCGHPVTPCNRMNALEEVIKQHPSPGLGQQHPQPVSHPAGPRPVTSPAAAQVPTTCQEDKANKPGHGPQYSRGTDPPTAHLDLRGEGPDTGPLPIQTPLTVLYLLCKEGAEQSVVAN